MTKNKFGVTKSQYKILLNLVKKYFDVEQVFVFGSRVGDQYRPDSDFDIVIINGFTAEQETEFRLALQGSLFLYQVDLIDYIKITNLKLKQGIDEQKVALV